MLATCNDSRVTRGPQLQTSQVDTTCTPHLRHSPDLIRACQQLVWQTVWSMSLKTMLQRNTRVFFSSHSLQCRSTITQLVMNKKRQVSPHISEQIFYCEKHAVTADNPQIMRVSCQFSESIRAPPRHNNTWGHISDHFTSQAWPRSTFAHNRKEEEGKERRRNAGKHIPITSYYITKKHISITIFKVHSNLQAVCVLLRFRSTWDGFQTILFPR